MRIDRRQLLQALGLGALGAVLSGGRDARADGETPPSRIVFYLQPHGNIPSEWTMPIPGGPTDRFAERSLRDLAPEDFSPTLRPLHRFRDRLLAIEGLSHTTALADIAGVLRAGTGDLNNHQIGVADVLTGAYALQRPGTYCTGGARSLDQELAKRLSAPGRFDSRVYGYPYVPNSIVSPFSYLGPGQASPMVSDPLAAFSDLLGYRQEDTGGTGREVRVRAHRGSVLDAAAREYDALSPRLGYEGRQKLEEHRGLVRDLEKSLAAVKPARTVTCSATYDDAAQPVRQFMSLVRMAFACDLTRVVTFTAPVPACPDLGYPADMTFHTYGHQSIEGATSCGSTYSPTAHQALIDLDAWHAGHFAYLLDQLDSVPEGSGTLLDHTVVCWMTELATPTHQHHDVCVLLAGGGNGFFKTGRYVRYPRDLPNPLPDAPRTGPAHNRLLVSLLRAMGQTDDTFGLAEAPAAGGATLSFRGALSELEA